MKRILFSFAIVLMTTLPTRSDEPKPTDARVFEMRTYYANPGKMSTLHARFRDHTCKLFEKHGMTNIGYWVPEKGQKGEGETLFYILSHKSPEAAKASFDAFRQDPDWVSARKASEEKAGGPLTVKDGVKSVFARATDFSPIR
jgi:NIPSNAP protein